MNSVVAQEADRTKNPSLEMEQQLTTIHDIYRKMLKIKMRKTLQKHSLIQVLM